jgi:hypothetical protein
MSAIDESLPCGRGASMGSGRLSIDFRWSVNGLFMGCRWAVDNSWRRMMDDHWSESRSQFTVSRGWLIGRRRFRHINRSANTRGHRRKVTSELLLLTPHRGCDRCVRVVQLVCIPQVPLSRVGLARSTIQGRTGICRRCFPPDDCRNDFSGLALQMACLCVHDSLIAVVDSARVRSSLEDS